MSIHCILRWSSKSRDIVTCTVFGKCSGVCVRNLCAFNSLCSKWWTHTPRDRASKRYLVRSAKTWRHFWNVNRKGEIMNLRKTKSNKLGDYCNNINISFFSPVSNTPLLIYSVVMWMNFAASHTFILSAHKVYNATFYVCSGFGTWWMVALLLPSVLPPI